MPGRRPTWLSLTALLAAAAAISAPGARAGPTVIRDEMLRDTAITPVLGRGYSIATNTYQSICLKDIVKTKPSYNFSYLFQEIQEDGTLARSTTAQSSVSAFYYMTTGVSMGGGSMEANTRVDENTQTEYHKHSLLVTILIDVYYSSVDESGTHMSPSAVALLANKDVPGFFDACGLYYVRSINRQAALLSTFTYETKSTTRDVAFEFALKFAVSQFSVSGASVEGSNNTKSTMTSAFSSSNLTIRTIAMGLGKDESVMLVSYDLDTFKSAVKGAFKATQAEDVGMVTSIEVSPWVENTEFQNNHKLEPISLPVLDATGKPELEPSTTPGAPPKPKMRIVSPYAQKRILTQNSEFLSEADRAARAKMNIYYKAKTCKTKIEVDMMIQGQPGRWSWRKVPSPPPENPEADMGDTFIVNNKSGQDQQPVKWLYAMLGPKQIQMIYTEYDSFVYGGNGPDVPEAEKDAATRSKLAMEYMTGAKKPPYPRNLFPGAMRCLDDLLQAGLTAVSYHTIPTCERLEEQFISAMGANVDNYCLPSYGPPPKKAGFAGGNSSGMDAAVADAQRSPKDSNEKGLLDSQLQPNAQEREHSRDLEQKDRSSTNGL